MQDNSKLRTEFQQQGYVIIDTQLEESVLDGAREDMARYFGEDREHPIHVPYADQGRVQDAWRISQNVLALAQSATVLGTLKALYDAEAQPFQTLNFYKGTEQAVHVDSIHFNSEPFGMMCGVWIALEDIGADQGPLVYYPGSHELPEMNYDDFGLEGDYENYPQYLGELEKLIEQHGFKPDYGLIKKGQAVIWSANVMHGGSKQNNKDLTRHSQVTHYYIGNPKCWRPSLSKHKRSYFKPDRVRDVSNEPPVFPVPDRHDYIGRIRGIIRRRILRR